MKARLLRRPFGQRFGTPPAFSPVVDFVGERLDEETKLVSLNARYFDPRLGRFLSADSADVVAPGVGVSRYGYSAGDPINLRDKNGRDFFGDIFGFLSGILDGFSFSPEFGGGIGGGSSDFGFGTSLSLSSFASSFGGNDSGSAFGGAPWSPPWDQEPAGTGLYPLGFQVGVSATSITNSNFFGENPDHAFGARTISTELAFDPQRMSEAYEKADMRLASEYYGRDTGLHVNVSVTRYDSITGLDLGGAGTSIDVFGSAVFGFEPTYTVQNVLTGGSDVTNYFGLSLSTNDSGIALGKSITVWGASIPVSKGQSFTFEAH